MEFIDDGRFADTRISGNEHQLWMAASDHAVERGEQSIDLARSPIQFFWNQEPVWDVVLPKREFVDSTVIFPFSKAALKINFSTYRCLVPFLGRFGEQLHDYSRDGSRNIFKPLTGGEWLPGNVAVHPFHRIGRRERKSPGQHLVKRNAK